MAFLENANLPPNSGAFYYDGPGHAGGYNPNIGVYDERMNAAGFKRSSTGRTNPFDGTRSMAVYTNLGEMSDALAGERIEPQKLLQAQYQPVSLYARGSRLGAAVETLHLKVADWRGAGEIGEAHGLYVESDGSFVLATAIILTSDSIPGEMEHPQMAVYNHERSRRSESKSRIHQFDGVVLGTTRFSAIVGIPYLSHSGKVVHEIAVMPQTITFDEVERTINGLRDSSLTASDVAKTGHVVVYEHGRRSSPAIEDGKLIKAYRSFVRP